MFIIIELLLSLSTKKKKLAWNNIIIKSRTIKMQQMQICTIIWSSNIHKYIAECNTALGVGCVYYMGKSAYMYFVFKPNKPSALYIERWSGCQWSLNNVESESLCQHLSTVTVGWRNVSLLLNGCQLWLYSNAKMKLQLNSVGVWLSGGEHIRFPFFSVSCILS